MRLRINCMACLQADGKPSDEAASVEMRDDGIYSFTCRRGHKTTTATQAQKFEVLFDLGALALLDGYTREAVTSMAASIERFFEYYSQVISLKHGVALETLTQAWKPVSKQSERQVGAFLFLYLLENKRALDPFILESRFSKQVDGKDPRTLTKFRNDVVHNGYIPSSELVLAYGDLIYQFVYRLIKELRSTSHEYMLKAAFHHVGKASALADGTGITTMLTPTLISLGLANPPAITFAEALKSLEAYRPWHS